MLKKGFREVLRFSKEFIEKEKCETVRKQKKGKKRYHKISSKSLPNISVVYDSFVFELWY